MCLFYNNVVIQMLNFCVLESLTLQEYHSLIRLLCSDFPFDFMQKIARYVVFILFYRSIKKLPNLIFDFIFITLCSYLQIYLMFIKNIIFVRNIMSGDTKYSASKLNVAPKKGIIDKTPRK